MVAVAGQVRQMGAGMASLAQESAPTARAGPGGLGTRARDGPGAARPRGARRRRAGSSPSRVEDLGAYDIAPFDGYRVIASDGSQIMPDRHDHLPCFLVNVGRGRHLLSGRDRDADVQARRSHWAPDDVYPLVGGIRQEADPRVVGARRFAAECDALRDVDGAAGVLPTVALVDGTLLLWWLEPDPDRLRGLQRRRPQDADLRRVPTMRRPRRKESGTLLGELPVLPADDRRRVDAQGRAVHGRPRRLRPVSRTSPAPSRGTRSSRSPGRRCLPVPSKPCEEAHPVTDAALHWSLLDDRAALGAVPLRTRTLTRAYDAPIDFVYLNVGARDRASRVPGVDHARPTWRRCAQPSWTSATRGWGIPVALSEAHEQAVVKAADRRAFVELARRQGVSRPSAKLARKRTSVL